MAESKYLKSLSAKEREDLKQKLSKQQGNQCFICDKEIDFRTQPTDIDHKVALSIGGDDNPSNFAITHASCNRSKGIRDLQLQRYIETFRKFVEITLINRGISQNVTVGDVLALHNGGKSEVGVTFIHNTIKLSYEANNTPSILEYFIYKDCRNEDVNSFIGMLPKEIVFHDSVINPRSIADLEPMIEEFYLKRPQLQPSLAYLSLDSEKKGKIKLFDGQHKAAAQLINGSDKLFVRVFINPDLDLIKKTNYRAHTKLSQVHFPQLISDKVGHSIFEEEFTSYCANADILKDSEKKFIDTLSSELRSEYRGYLKSFYKFDVLSSTNLEIMKFVETVSARSKSMPLSFESLRRGLLEIFLYLKPSEEPLSISKRMRELEMKNMQTILELLAQEVLCNKFDTNVGIFKIEEKLQNNDPKITIDHLLAYRMLRQSALIAWAGEFKTALNTYFNSHNKYLKNWSTEKYLWIEHDDNDKIMIRKMIRFIKSHPAWTVKQENIVKLISTTSVTDWRTIILEGKLPGATEAIYEPMNGGQILIKATSITI